ncbi:MAG: glycosyltransferase N-terminal domain-containing protein [Aquificota bacterium]|nr:glycosyltransferase N-terminal domain-containing protein [Aquificota bacterium]
MGWELKKRLLIEKPNIPPGEWVWFHCASVGEFITAEPLIRKVKERFGVFLTYFSPKAEGFLKSRADAWDVLFPLPFDLPHLVRRLEGIVKPRVLIVIEREMWPFLITATGVRKILLNARSKGDLLERLLASRYSLVVARTERDAEGFRRAGAKRVVVCGNLKLALEVSSEPVDVGLPEGSFLFVAGSTHPGEEVHLVEAFLELKRQVPIVMILAPRHPDRVDHIAELLESKGINWCFRTSPKNRWEVMVLNTLGELKGVYTKADVTFVGGTLVPVGGHNLLEPALLGKPVLFGPNTHKVRDMEEIVVREGYGFKVSGPEDIVSVTLRLLRDGFRPAGDLRRLSEEVRECYTRVVLSELEEVTD